MIIWKKINKFEQIKKNMKKTNNFSIDYPYEGVVVDVINNNKVIIEIDGQMKTYSNSIFTLRKGERVKFEAVISQITKAVIYDKIIDHKD
jgi:hypothetical protein